MTDTAEMKAVATAIHQRLERKSAQVLEQVQVAAKCIVFLHLQGSTVQTVTVRPDYTVIDIDQPGEWLKGSIRLSRVNGYHREVQMVAKVMGCQVQWIVIEKPRLLQREG